MSKLREEVLALGSVWKSSLGGVTEGFILDVLEVQSALYLE